MSFLNKSQNFSSRNKEKNSLVGITGKEGINDISRDYLLTNKLEEYTKNLSRNNYDPKKSKLYSILQPNSNSLVKEGIKEKMSNILRNANNPYSTLISKPNKTLSLRYSNDSFENSINLTSLHIPSATEPSFNSPESYINERKQKRVSTLQNEIYEGINKPIGRKYYSPVDTEPKSKNYAKFFSVDKWKNQKGYTNTSTYFYKSIRNKNNKVGIQPGFGLTYREIPDKNKPNLLGFITKEHKEKQETWLGKAIKYNVQNKSANFYNQSGLKLERLKSSRLVRRDEFYKNQMDLMLLG
ncbi:MAG: hypothetical protein MJ252_01205 [archaeon]|nr:hypothetical protein [archaeon]